MSRATPDTFDPESWSRLGAESGRRNDPRVPDGPAPVRDLLASAWLVELREERLAFLDALDALHQRRLNARRHLHELQVQAAIDARQGAAIATLVEKLQELADERAIRCDQFLQVLETVTQRAVTCDASWRAANERHRDRRLSIAPTTFVVPPDLSVIPPDPVA